MLLTSKSVHFVLAISLLLWGVGLRSTQAQSVDFDSLKIELSKSGNDTTNLLLLGMISNGYRELSPDSAYEYAEKMLSISTRMELKLEVAWALAEMGYAMINMGNYPRSLQFLLRAEELLIKPESERGALSNKYADIDEYSLRSMSPQSQRLSILGRVYQSLGIVYWNAGVQDKGLSYYRMAAEVSEGADNKNLLSITYATLGRTYLAIGRQDSAKFWLQNAYDLASESGYNRYKGSILLNMGHVYSALGDLNMAQHYYLQAKDASAKFGYYRGVVASCLYLAQLKKTADQYDSVLYYINAGLPVANFLNNPDLLLRCYVALADFYKTMHNNDSTVKYLSKIIEINNEKFSAKRVQEFQNIDFDREQQQLELEAAEAEYQSKLKLYTLLVGLLIVICIAIFIWRNSVQRKKSNLILSQQKNSLEIALTNLTRTQNQLVQSEKMASLGELTAGIAHEIQNPLNFVNNFSEVNSELVGELEQAASNGNLDEVRSLAKNIRENEEKIASHGKRADGIVRSMLQHSRASSGQKELTDINALCDEYLRLAFHGYRAKDKSFNAKFETDFDESIPMLNIVPQDVGRVILNLINNAFYAVSEKAQHVVSADYNPLVTVSTRNIDNKVQISVKDNGNGIPESIKEKIFQPFFTTKPAGQGTGLGLSLGYDIIKAHGGEVRVESEDSKGTEFMILLAAK